MMPIKNNYLACLNFCNKETKESCRILSTPLIHEQFFLLDFTTIPSSTTCL